MISDPPAAFRLELERGVEHLRLKDRRLARFIERAGPCAMPLRSTPSPFSALDLAV